MPRRTSSTRWSWPSRSATGRARPGAASRRRPHDVRGSDRADLQERAAEAAFAIGRTSRATAYLEAAIGALDARRDRVRIGLLYERLGVVRRAAGDAVGARAAAKRAVELIPRDATPERATVLASYAQMSMLDGLFSDAQRLARDAIKVARACGPAARDQEIHATTTLGRRARVGHGPERRDRAPPRGRDGRARGRRPRCPVPRDRQPHDGAGPRRAARRGRRGGVPRDRGCATGRPGGRLRQLPRRQRHGVAGPAGPLAGGAPPERAGARVAADRGRVPDGHRPARHDRDRDRVGRARRPAARPDGARVRRAARAAAGGAVLPGGRLVRAVGRRRRRRGAVRGARLGRRPNDRGVGPRRADDRDGRAGRRGDRRRGAGTAAARAAGRRPLPDGRGAGRGDGAGRGGRGAIERRLAADRRGLPRDGPRVPAAARGRRRRGGLGQGRDDVA